MVKQKILIKMRYFFSDFFWELHNELRSTRPSLKFWYLVILACLIVLGAYDLKLFSFFSLIMSLVSLFFIFGRGIFDEYGKYLWVFLTPTGWVILIMASLNWLFNNTILKFNNWLDRNY